ncbi:MAG: hypothetical protein KAI17_06020 [Thiotrichaceae bacterium]|nr:hypothetical protein [Thiotrichaceae bacterium]
MKKFIITKKDTVPAYTWITNQITKHAGYFPRPDMSEMGHNSQVHDAFREIKPNDPEALNDFCEKYLDKGQWHKMKTSIRAYRLKLKRRDDLTIDVKRISVKIPTYDKLKALSDERNEPMNDTIEYLLAVQLREQN